MIGIHPIHRQLAMITHMCLDQRGNMIIGTPELKLMMPLLRANLLLIQQLDSLKELAFHAHEMGDHDWEMELCRQIDELEATLL